MISKIKVCLQMIYNIGVCQPYLHFGCERVISIEYYECCYTDVIRDFQLYPEPKKDFKFFNIYLIMLQKIIHYIQNIKPCCWILGWLFAFYTGVLISIICNFLLAFLTCNIIPIKRIVDLIDCCMKCEHSILLFYIC